jgi:pyridoxamine 5'-phosphate oxidase-like protein
VPIPREQLRLDDDELDALLTSERTLRAATVSRDGTPHVVPLWFVWRDGFVWINSLRRSRRARDIRDGSRVALCFDTGIEYGELRGAVLYGRFEDASDDPSLPEVKAAFGAKYWKAASVPDLKSHIWLRLRPDRLASWDFRKIPAGRDRRLEAARHPKP